MKPEAILRIWRPIRLEAYDDCRIEDVSIRQEHKDGSVSLAVGFSSRARHGRGDQLTAKIALYAPNGDRLGCKDAFKILPSDNNCSGAESTDTLRFTADFRIDSPALWWPNGFGGQPLYEVKIRLCSCDQEQKITEEDTASRRIGLRTLTVCSEKDHYGESFAFEVNGVQIFTMGADYIPEDCILARISREQRAFLMDSCVRAHFNCIRIWGGGLYPDEDFMEMCDERGLIVWQDLMFACHIYDATDSFLRKIGEEIRDNLTRMRHHACLGLICGNNELESAWLGWENFKAQSPALKADYTKMFEDFIPKIARECAPDTFYWPSSPSSGGGFDDPDSENRGDVHYWEVWHGMKPFTEYRKYFFRFCSEFGFQSFPSMKTIRSFAGEGDLNIFSPVMESHQKNPSANGKIMTYLSANI